MPSVTSVTSVAPTQPHHTRKVRDSKRSFIGTPRTCTPLSNPLKVIAKKKPQSPPQPGTWQKAINTRCMWQAHCFMSSWPPYSAERTNFMLNSFTSASALAAPSHLSHWQQLQPAVLPVREVRKQQRRLESAPNIARQMGRHAPVAAPAPPGSALPAHAAAPQRPAAPH